MTTIKFPSIETVSAELRAINANVEGECDVRLQVYPDGQWAVRSGLSDYDQDHRGFWGASTVPGVGGRRNRPQRFNSTDMARDLIAQAKDDYASGTHAQGPDSTPPQSTPPAAPSGYADCACRDCMEIAIGGWCSERRLCSECRDAGCVTDSECNRPDAYGAGEAALDTSEIAVKGEPTAGMTARATAGYNGHRNRTHWNVALWLGNDEGLYRLALQFIREATSLDRAATLMLSELKSGGMVATPDGHRYSFTAIRAAMSGLRTVR